MRILITGATGFLGSHIADALVADGHELMVLKRTKSNLRNCLFFQEIANWENIDDDGWTERQTARIVRAAATAVRVWGIR